MKLNVGDVGADDGVNPTAGGMVADVPTFPDGETAASSCVDDVFGLRKNHTAPKMVMIDATISILFTGSDVMLSPLSGALGIASGYYRVILCARRGIRSVSHALSVVICGLRRLYGRSVLCILRLIICDTT